MTDEDYGGDENYYDENNEYNVEVEDNQMDMNADFEILKANQIEARRNEQIKHFAEYSNLSEDESTLVLVHFQWNYDSLQCLWYENIDQNKIQSGIEQSEGSKKKTKEFFIKNKMKEGFCIICQDKLDETAMGLKCNHRACYDCWCSYFEAKIDDPLTCILTLCPMAHCNLLVYPSFYLKCFSNNPEQLAKYKVAMNRNYTDSNSDIKWCPNEKCGSCVRLPGHGAKEITCECGYVFCFKCVKETHRPCDCAMIEAWESKNKSQSENVKWLLANTKQCPQCHKYIEKNQGCNHMTCQKKAGGCGHEFCWICLDEWKKHGSEYYKCKFFDESKVDKNQEKKVTDAKFELEKYANYFEKFLNHQKSQSFAEKLLANIQKFADRFTVEKNIPMIEVRFLIEAVNTILNCRITLKNTYVYGYYMKKCNESKMFEYHQSCLDNQTDKLHEMMEGEQLPKMILIDNYEEFNAVFTLFKNNVNNLMGAMNKFKDNVLNDMEFKSSSLIESIESKD